MVYIMYFHLRKDNYELTEKAVIFQTHSPAMRSNKILIIYPCRCLLFRSSSESVLLLSSSMI